MPLWVIYHPPDTTFTTPESKRALAESITSHYTSVGLPAFYVVVEYLAVDPGKSTFVGGMTASEYSDKPFVRISVEHIAVRLRNEDSEYLRVTNDIDALLKPHIEDQGYDWEYHIDETEKRLWRINGMIPPPFRSEEEKMWSNTGKPVEWSGGRKTE